MKIVWILSLCAVISWGISQTQLEEMNGIAQSKYYKMYGKLSSEEKNDIETIYQKKINILSLAQKSQILQSKIYQKKIEEAKRDILIRMFLEKKKASITVTEKEKKAYYKKHINDYTTLHAYTLVRKRKEDLDTYIKMLHDTPTKKQLNLFKTLCKKHSQHPTKSKSGDLGFIAYNTMVQPFGKKAFSLKTNTFTQTALKTVLGYHLIYISQRHINEYNKVEPLITKILRQKAYNTWFQAL